MTSKPVGAPSGVESPYWEVTAWVEQDTEEVWSLFCFEVGARGAEVIEETDKGLAIRHYFDQAPFATIESGLTKFKADYPASQPPQNLTLASKQPQDWATAWREHFTPITVGERLCVRPPWQVEGDRATEGHDAKARSERLKVVINPGQGFGTGWHPSTHLALCAIERVLIRETLPATHLDVGTGSGILAIAARLLGVPSVHGLDVDGQVMTEVEANFELSGLSAPDRLTVGTPEGVTGTFDLVTANITAPVLLAHREDLTRLTARDGWLIVSGVLIQEHKSVAQAFSELGLQVQEETQRESWWCGTLRRTS